MLTDIAITRLSPGFYSIAAETARGRAFMRTVEGAEHGAAYSDDTRMAAGIAEGAVRDGLAVTLDGQQLRLKNAQKGDGR